MQSRASIVKTLLSSLFIIVGLSLYACNNTHPTNDPPLDKVDSGQPADNGDASVVIPVPEDSGMSDLDAGENDAADAEVDAAIDAAPKTQGECLKACEQQHPVGVALSKALDDKWLQVCNPSCTAGNPNGTTFPPNVKTDGGAKDCKVAVLTPTEACSTCTVENACKEWDGLFQSPDGVALNQCSLPCWSLPQ